MLVGGHDKKDCSLRRLLEALMSVR